jgi:hypothetical protein
MQQGSAYCAKRWKRLRQNAGRGHKPRGRSMRRHRERVRRQRLTPLECCPFITVTATSLPPQPVRRANTRRDAGCQRNIRAICFERLEKSLRESNAPSPGSGASFPGDAGGNTIRRGPGFVEALDVDKAFATANAKARASPLTAARLRVACVEAPECAIRTILPSHLPRATRALPNIDAGPESPTFTLDEWL